MQFSLLLAVSFSNFKCEKIVKNFTAICQGLHNSSRQELYCICYDIRSNRQNTKALYLNIQALLNSSHSDVKFRFFIYLSKFHNPQNTNCPIFDKIFSSIFQLTKYFFNIKNKLSILNTDIYQKMLLTSSKKKTKNR